MRTFDVALLRSTADEALHFLVLGIYTATSPDTEVECDFDGDGTFEESDECKSKLST